MEPINLVKRTFDRKWNVLLSGQYFSRVGNYFRDNFKIVSLLIQYNEDSFIIQIYAMTYPTDKIHISVHILLQGLII